MPWLPEKNETLPQKLALVEPGFSEVVQRLPPRNEPVFPGDWLHLEMIERYAVLRHAGIQAGANVLELGAGAHALATVPLAYLVGNTGRVVAVELERWHSFGDVVGSSGLSRRVIPVACDATRLPFPFECFDLAVIVHGIRSMRDEGTISRILREMLRLSPRIFVAESLPVARTRAQEAHLEMYNLREEIFEARLGRPDDIRYLPLEKITELIEDAGGRVFESTVLDIGLPHFLAFIPRKYVEGIPDGEKRDNLLRRWEAAYAKIVEHGEEHPPAAVITAVRGTDRS